MAASYALILLLVPVVAWDDAHNSTNAVPGSLPSVSPTPSWDLGCAPDWMGACRLRSTEGDEIDYDCCGRESSSFCAAGFRYDPDSSDEKCGKTGCTRRTCCVYCLPGDECRQYGKKFGESQNCSNQAFSIILFVCLLLISCCFCTFAFGFTLATTQDRRPHQIHLEQVLVGDAAPPRAVVVQGRGLDGDVEMAAAVVADEPEADPATPVATELPAAAHAVKIR